MVYNAYREFLKYVKEAWTEDERESYFKFDEVSYYLYKISLNLGSL